MLMTDPTARRRKLAEAMASKIDPECCYDILVLIDRIADILAAEGAVNPERLAYANAEVDESHVEIERLEQQLAAVRREFDEIVTDKDKQLAAERSKVAEAIDILTNKVFKPEGAICCALAALHSTGDGDE